MITQYEVRSLLEKDLPYLALKDCPSRASLQVYACINDFTDYTKRVIEEHNFNQARQCFAVAENLYLHGDSMVKRLIENSFVYCLSCQMQKSSTERFMVNCILPDALYKIYRKQATEFAP